MIDEFPPKPPYPSVLRDLDYLRIVLRPNTDAGETLPCNLGDERPAYQVLDDVIAALGGDPRSR